MQWISATTDAGEASASIGAMARRLESRMNQLSSVIPPDGGLRKADLLGALSPDSLGEPLTRPGDHAFANVLDLVSPSGMAISVQTGRAKTNNEAILAVLAGASHPDVRWVALILPDRYKGSSTAPSVERDVRALIGSSGVTLDLTGILVLVYVGSPGARGTASSLSGVVDTSSRASRQAARVRTPPPPLADASPGPRRGTHKSALVNKDSPEWARASTILESRPFQVQRARVGRAALKDDVVHAVLAQLLAGGGRATSEELSQVPGLEGRAFDPSFASLRRSLNVDGYEVLTLDSDLTTVKLDYALLHDQFGVSPR